jgi:Bifunctional DNA primase/polymerase, N-terminal
MSPLGRAALAYAERLGIAVHPISVTKAPLSPHGFKDATRDPATIRDWWSRTPDANIGTICDWFFVVDVDPRNGGHDTVAAWPPFPPTWEALTGSGGLHVYFKHDPALDTIPLGKLLGGVDIKGGSRGYVLLPPSRSSSGPYRWRQKPSQTPLAEAPRWLVDLIVETKRKPVAPREPVDPTRYAGVDRVDRARRYASRIPGAVSGQGGHDATVRAACMIARGFALSHDEAFAVMSEWNQTCQPPWSDAELKRKITETLDRGTMTIGALLKGRAA